MSKFKKYFGEFNITWPRVILFAVITAVCSAVVLLIPFLDNTSFQDIGVYLDCWFLFAIFIIVNCKTWWEAALKCFVFFLISQPLIYLIQVPFNDFGWKIFRYYGYWFKVTLLTLPGAAIAFLVKKKTWLSVAVLSVATLFLSAMSVNHFTSAIGHFPHHLLSGMFCLALTVFLIFVLLDDKKHRSVALGLAGAVFIACIVIFIVGNTGGSSADLLLDDGEWICTVGDESVVTVEITDGSHATITSRHNGATDICFENADGDQLWYTIVADGKNLMISPID